MMNQRIVLKMLKYGYERKGPLFLLIHEVSFVYNRLDGRPQFRRKHLVLTRRVRINTKNTWLHLHDQKTLPLSG